MSVCEFPEFPPRSTGPLTDQWAHTMGTHHTHKYSNTSISPTIKSA